MKNIKIVYQYDGSAFYGFQRQPKKRTVQGEIEKNLNIFLNENINLISSGRTDRGVHAIEQVSNFMTQSKIPLERLFYALSKSLPTDIQLFSLYEVDENFHARFSAIERVYCYKITWEKNPFLRRYFSYIPQKIEKERFLKILEPFLGKHNFQNFRLQDKCFTNPIREIYSIDCVEISEGLEVYIQANAFLKSQIRIMLGIALEIYFGRIEMTRIKEMLKSPEKKFPKKIAAPEGLYLFKIIYKEDKL